MKFIVFLFLFYSTLFSIDFNKNFANDNNVSYINLTSNVKDTEIFIDNKSIGNTPIELYEVSPNKDINITAVVDKNYYKEDLTKMVKVLRNTIPTYSFDFQKADAKIFLVGIEADLYMNGKFVKKLSQDNRVLDVKAQKNMKLKFVNGYDFIILTKDIHANNFYKIDYEIQRIPKDIRLYTVTIDDLMWEDTEHAARTNIDWEGAEDYCKFLRIGEYKNWRLPSFKELKSLEENNKDDIYNGYGDSFYWSSSVSSSENKIWDYSDTQDFNNGRTRKPIKEFDFGLIRCVRDMEKNKTKTEKNMKENKKDKI